MDPITNPNLKKYVEDLKKENPHQNNSHKTQEGMNVDFNYVQKKMTNKRKRVDHDRSACKQELNKFSNMSLEKKAAMDMEDEVFWNFGPSKQQKGSFKEKT